MPRLSSSASIPQEAVQEAVRTVRRWPPIETVLAWAQTEPQARMLATIGLIAALWLGRALVVRLVRRRGASPDTVLLWRQITGYIALLVGVLYVADVWFDGLMAVLTALSVIAAALTLVSKELLLNLLAWPVIAWRQVFTLGDHVAIGEQAGVVVDMGMLFVTLAETESAGTFTGRTTKVPNAVVLTQPARNLTRPLPFVWLSLRVPLTPASNWQAAEALLHPLALDLATEVTSYERRHLRGTGQEAAYPEAPVELHLTVDEGVLTLIVRVLVEVGEEASTRDVFWRRALPLLAANDGVEVKLA